MTIRQCLISLCHIIYESLYDIFIVMRKNLRVRRRRYVALILELCTPVIIASVLVVANTRKSLLRIEAFVEDAPAQEDVELIDLVEGFYDLGSHFDEAAILGHTLCNEPKDPVVCAIGYIADPITESAIFQSPQIHDFFNNTPTFIKFDDEKRLEECLQERDECPEFAQKALGISSDPLLLFRGAVVFETSVNDANVRYKIRLMEKYYGSLRHVIKTSRLDPSIYDRREYGRSYLESGFLSLQLILDRMIIEYMKSTSNNPNAFKLDFISPKAECTCHVSMHEIPHRQSDTFSDFADPLELTTDYDSEAELLQSHEEEPGFSQKDRGDITRAHQVHKQSLIVSTILVLSFTFLLPSEQRRITSEKENGLTVLLLVTGMTHRMQWIGNLFAITISYVLTITVVVILLKVSFNSNEGAIFEFTSGSVLWLLFFLYVISLASVCYFTTVFFDKPSLAISASLCFWVVSFVGGVYHIDYFYDTVPIWASLPLCFHPSIALQLALRLLIRLERHQVHTDLLSISRNIPTDPLRIVMIVIIFIIDIFIYMTLTIYLDRVLVTKYGVHKPWYYIFMRSEYTWNSDRGRVTPEEMVSRDRGTSIPELAGFEPCRDENAEISIVTRNLAKKYGDKVALDNLNLRFYHGEIFALIGNNGSGKSTMLNIFSGFTPSTSGTATIFGYDIITHMVQIQAFTGMCPQSSWLYDDLTLYEHLIIFGRLRGLHGRDAKEDAMELLEKLRIHEMAHWTVRKLSKGDKRKLSLAVALIGNPKVVLLDEPTAGLDYYSRRAVWDLLLKIRSNHTIIFSTKFMDEAELLGDRIGILSSGKMEVCGSSGFLRRHLGLGYSLKLKIDPQKRPDPEEILRVVRNSSPNASLRTLPISPHPSRLFTCNLPVDEYSSATMSTLFADLSQLKETMGISGFSISHASIEEVFLHVERQLNPDKIPEVTLPVGEVEQEEDHRENVQRKMEQKRQRCIWFFQYITLVRKRMWYTWRSKKLFLYQVIIPLIIFVLGLVRFSSHIELDGRSAPPLELGPDIYKDGITLYHANKETFFSKDVVEAAIGPSAVYTVRSDLSGDYIYTEYLRLRHKHFVGISVETGNGGEIYVHFSPYVLHSAPIALNLFSNTLVKYLSLDRSIITTNHPLQHPYFTGPNYEEDPFAPYIVAMLTSLATLCYVAFCVIFPLEERLSEVKHLQLMSGVGSFTYWTAILTWDLLMGYINVFILYWFAVFYPPLNLISVKGIERASSIGRSALALASMYSSLTMVYLISQFSRSKSASFALVVCMAILFALILPLYSFGVEESHTSTGGVDLPILLLVPPYSFASAQRKHILTLLGSGRCNHFTPMGEEFYCIEDESETKDLRKVTCCKNCAMLPGSNNCYYRWEIVRLPWSKEEEVVEDHEHVGHYSIQDEIKSRSIFVELVTMLVVGLFFNLLTIFLDSNTWHYFLMCINGLRGRAFQTNVDDEDILDEMDRVEKMVCRRGTDEEALVVHNLCKTFGTYPVIHNISLGLHPGESFGMIGVNGGGKSTLFNVLTSYATYGNVYSTGGSLTTKRSVLLSKIGYAPHHGKAFFDYLTCKETLILFARLRGLNSKDANDVGDTIMKQMGIEEFQHTKAGDITGGVKRRLLIAIALIAEPPIILLDEPTADSDPVSRRKCWEIIKDIKRSGHSLVFSSHEIHECEDLCDRIAILLDGKFQCIGSPSHLLEKFGRGYKLIVKLIPKHAENQGYVSSLSEAIVSTFEPCTTRDRRRNVIQYVIHDANVSWDFLFQMMEHIMLRYNDLVEDYAFSDTTMEEVFLSFVPHQNCGRILEQSKGGCFDF